ncbi:MAG: tyrosine-type recombinase/integrase [Hyphomicrobiales bacterium]|nr:tyrosine-type recombinase/integrase [Hyphomicrobiales bacterium]
MNAIVSALRFFFVHTIDRPDLARKLVRLRYPRRLPDVLSPDEVRRLLGATVCLKHLAALSVAYGAGLRVAEVSALKVGDVDSTRMLLRVERGKGGRDRNAMLSVDLLSLLRQCRLSWDRQVAGLADRFQVVTWDLPGHGDSGKPADISAYSNSTLSDPLDRQLSAGFQYSAPPAKSRPCARIAACRRVR